MKRKATIGQVFLLLAVALLLTAIASAQSKPVSRQISSGGSAVPQPQALGSGVLQYPEIDTGIEEDEDPDTFSLGIVNRTPPKSGPGRSVSARAGKKAKSNPELQFGFNGLNFRQQRLANGGNQFSVEPPDQGLCAGNGYIFESVNDVINIFDTNGNSLLTAPIDLNTFYGYPAAILRATGGIGPSITDPSCIFDTQTQRWFNVVLTLDRANVNPTTGYAPSQALSGRNHLDIAVSDTSSPLGSWTIYRIPVQDDGTEGTPDHACRPAATTPAGRTHPAACLGDYPHIGADANGFYITTNEFELFNNGYIGSQIYAIPKAQLVIGGSINVFQYDTSVDGNPIAGLPGFTVWPAQSPGISSFATEAGGTEYFLSSLNVFTASDNRVGLWALTNTSALNSGNAPTLVNNVVASVEYTDPPRANQPGSGTITNLLDYPVGQCIGDLTCDTFLNGIALALPQAIGRLNSNDARMQQVMYANGKIWGALGTALSTPTDPTNRAGIAYFVIKPQVTSTSVTGKMAQQGYVSLDGHSLTYPTTAVTASGRGVISFTMVGPATFAGSGYVSLDAIVGAGTDVHTAHEGVGLQDGFSEYTQIFGGRPRWGDYGAAAVVGNSIWFAAETINQSCSLATYEAGFTSAFGSCGGTRASLGNWGTHISKVTP